MLVRTGAIWNGLSLGMMSDPVLFLPKTVHPDVAAPKLQQNPHEYWTVRHESEAGSQQCLTYVKNP